MASILDSDMSKGIGQLLREKRVQVPYYQRSYAWKKAQVQELYGDLRRALDEGRDYYFLGSVVGCQDDPKSDHVEIVDGQQRLASTYILLAAIRNQLLALREKELADKFEEQHLFHEKGLKDPVRHPGIRLNETDDDYFQQRVAARPTQQKEQQDLRVPSHALIDDAAKSAAKLIREIVGTRSPTDQKGELDKWLEFIQQKARIIFIVVDDPADAFMIFETLNDRGLDLSVADLTKNYLFMKAGKENIETAKTYWSRMASTLAATSESDITKVYIHHLWSSYNGVSRDKELFRHMRAKYDNAVKAMIFTKLLSDKSSIYAALANSDSDFWNTYGRHAKRHLAILNSSLKVTQVRMLLLAVVDHFDRADAEVALQCCVWWSVRFLIAGGSPSRWEAHYAKRAKAIRDGRIKNAAQLIDDMVSDVPSDDAFRAAFASEAEVGKAIGRYFLNCFEDALDGKQFPHLATDDPKLADREHIMPESPDETNWPRLKKEDHDRLAGRIGNHALLTPAENKARKNGSFKSAKTVYKKSNFRLTKKISEHQGNDWNEAGIEERQKEMAELAVTVWPARPQEQKKVRKKRDK